MEWTLESWEVGFAIWREQNKNKFPDFKLFGYPNHTEVSRQDS